MHLTHPRIPPLSDAELSPAQREALAPASYPGTPPLNIFRTLAHSPAAYEPSPAVRRRTTEQTGKS
jgi:4-carboxymuconolactone decarboxylase